MKNILVPIVINKGELTPHSYTEESITLNDYFKTSSVFQKYCGKDSELAFNGYSAYVFDPLSLHDNNIEYLTNNNKNIILNISNNKYKFKVDITESLCTYKLESVENSDESNELLFDTNVDELFIILDMNVPDDFIINVKGIFDLKTDFGIKNISFDKTFSDNFITLNDIVTENIGSISLDKIQNYVTKYNSENNTDPDKMLYFDNKSFIPVGFSRMTTTECKYSIMDIPVFGITTEDELKLYPDFEYIPDELVQRTFTIHMNNGTNETFKVSISEYKINPNDDIIYTRILDAIEPSLKKRVSEDVHYEYELLGISTSPDGDIINTADYKFSEDDDIYFIWNKVEVIGSNDTNSSPVDLDYIPAGKLQSINDCLFVTPKNGTVVDKIEFCNNYYYLLCKNNHIYKLDKNFNIVNDLNLSAYNKDVEKNDIFVSGNVLIIKAGKYILTDNETVKNNSSVNENTLVISNGETEQKINTKAIVKINVR